MVLAPVNALVSLVHKVPADAEVLTFILVLTLFLVLVYVLVPEFYQAIQYLLVLVRFKVMEYVMAVGWVLAVEDSSQG